MAPPNQYVLEGYNITMQCSAQEADSTHWVPSNTLITYAQVEEEVNGDYEFECFLFFGSTSVQKRTQAIVIGKY